VVQKELGLDPDHHQGKKEPERRYQTGPAPAAEEAEEQPGETEPLGQQQPLPRQEEAGEDLEPMGYQGPGKGHAGHSAGEDKECLNHLTQGAVQGEPD